MITLSVPPSASVRACVGRLTGSVSQSTEKPGAATAMLTVQFWGISFCLNFGKGSPVQSAPISYIIDPPSLLPPDRYGAVKAKERRPICKMPLNDVHDVARLTKPVAGPTDPPRRRQIAAAPFITQI